jgi:hypothetical protein
MTGLWKAWKAKAGFPLFPRALGNLANGRRDFHIPTAPTMKADVKVENQKQVSHFPTATVSLICEGRKPGPRAGFALPAGGRRSAPPKSQKVVVA